MIKDNFLEKITLDPSLKDKWNSADKGIEERLFRPREQHRAEMHYLIRKTQTCFSTMANVTVNVG